jgi:hypothetical protein
MRLHTKSSPTVGSEFTCCSYQPSGLYIKMLYVRMSYSETATHCVYLCFPIEISYSLFLRTHLVGFFAIDISILGQHYMPQESMCS